MAQVEGKDMTFSAGFSVGGLTALEGVKRMIAAGYTPDELVNNIDLVVKDFRDNMSDALNEFADETFSEADDAIEQVGGW